MAYPTDLTQKQWSLIKTLLPPPRLEGRRRTISQRKILNAIFYLLRTGCAWAMLPKDFPKYKTVFYYFTKWKDDGTWEKIHDALVVQVRIKAGRKPTPSAVSIDSQSVKTQKGGSKATMRERKSMEGNDILLLIHSD